MLQVVCRLSICRLSVNSHLYASFCWTSLPIVARQVHDYPARYATASLKLRVWRTATGASYLLGTRQCTSYSYQCIWIRRPHARGVQLCLHWRSRLCTSYSFQCIVIRSPHARGVQPGLHWGHSCAPVTVSVHRDRDTFTTCARRTARPTLGVTAVHS